MSNHSTTWNHVQTEGNGAAVRASADVTINRLIELQARRSPDACAVIHRNRQITYRELNRKANQLARYLQKQGIGPESLVGICLDRSIEMVIGILGTLKAGGAYLPLDPNYPALRMAAMVEDASPSCLITQDRLTERLGSFGIHMIALDSQWARVIGEGDGNPPSNATADNLAYVIYTSGSTGKPKGVMIEHRALVNFTEAASIEYGLNASDRVLQFASFSFDASVEEIFPCLVRGGTLVLRTDEMLATVDSFLQACGDWGITVLDLPTAYWHQLVGHLNEAEVALPATLRLVIIGGEPARAGSVAEWFSSASPSIRLVNSYGPTEATVVATTCDLAASAPSQCVPIGRPLRNVEIHILDDQLQPTPTGAVGELYIGGAGVARGYHKRSKLTAERFVANPFNHALGDRLYRTGDLARYLPTGDIAFLGRVDDQVKIRGYRIELGEVEYALGRHPAVREVTVSAREDVPGDRRLVAYVVLRNALAPTSGEWRRFLSQTLPDYMIPSAYVTLDALPLSPSGKVDRHSLPMPGDRQSHLAAHLDRPGSDLEETIANIWAEVLRLPHVGVDDSFFDLGGDSILSIQIASKARRCGIHFAAEQLFHHPTVAQLSKVAKADLDTSVRQKAATGPAPLSPAQRWLLAHPPADLHAAQHWALLQVRHELDDSSLGQAVRLLMAHHQTLRLRFSQSRAGWRQNVVSVEKSAALEQVDLSMLAEAEQAAAMRSSLEETQASLNLSQGPIARFVLFDLGRRKSRRLLIVIHEMAVDRLSWTALLGDLDLLCRQLTDGQAAQLSAPADLHAWIRKLAAYAQEETLAHERSFWLSMLENLSADLPSELVQTPHPAGSHATNESVNSMVVSLSEEETWSLLNETPKAYQMEVHEVLLTALAHALTQWTKSTALLIDLENDGRAAFPEDENPTVRVGRFGSYCPAVLRLERSAQFGDMLKSIKEQLRQIPNRGIGFGLLRYLRNDKAFVKSAQAFPTPAVCFRYVEQAPPMLSDSSSFMFSGELGAPAEGLRDGRRHPIDVEARIVDDRLHLFWIFDQRIYREQTIESTAQSCLKSLTALNAHCRTPNAGGYTPSDFPEVDLSQQELDVLVSEIANLIG